MAAAVACQFGRVLLTFWRWIYSTNASRAGSLYAVSNGTHTTPADAVGDTNHQQAPVCRTHLPMAFIVMYNWKKHSHYQRENERRLHTLFLSCLLKKENDRRRSENNKTNDIPPHCLITSAASSAFLFGGVPLSHPSYIGMLHVSFFSILSPKNEKWNGQEGEEVMSGGIYLWIMSSVKMYALLLPAAA